VFVKDVRPGPLSGISAMLAEFQGTLFFAADAGTHGLELWRSDGTEEGTVLVQDIAPGPARSDVRAAVLVGNRLYFAADDGLTGLELWTGRAAVLADQPERAIRDLRDEAEALGLPSGIEKRLTAKLEAAADALARREDRAAAIHLLEAFLGDARRLSPATVSEPARASLIEFAEDIVNLLDGETLPFSPFGP
jgi:ELWxxDGT repeat protein